MNMLFINGSPNKNGNTAALAAKIANGKPYKTLNLTDYRINCYGQTLPGDQFDEVVAAMRDADTVIINPLTGRGRRRHGKSEYDCDWFAAVLAQHLRQRAQPAGQILRPGGKRLDARQKADVHFAGRSAGEVDAGRGRIHDAAFRRALRLHLSGHGDERASGGRACGEAVRETLGLRPKPCQKPEVSGLRASL